MRRLQELQLSEWYKAEKRKPLIIRGARQVGKSTLVRDFAKCEGLDLVEVNLEKRRLQTTRQEPFTVNDLIQEALLVAKKELNKKTLLFFDEIQEDPVLLKWLRYFFEEKPEIAVVAAGSLLELALEDANFSFPVGRVSFLHMGPMTFREFLWALGEEQLETSLFKRLQFNESTHQLALALLKQYLFVGGMPEAVSTFARTQQLTDVRKVQSDIFQTYMADFPKYGKRINLDRIQRVFAQAPARVGLKLKLSAFDPLSPAKEVRKVLEKLAAAKIVRQVFHAECGGLPLKATVDESVQKTYFLDVGLMNYGLDIDFNMLSQEFSKLFVSKGGIAEQFVAQHLAHLGDASAAGELFYWLRDKGTQKGEIDFVVQDSDRIVPIEVKADAGGKLRSLFYFAHEKKWHEAIKFSLQPYGETSPTHKIPAGKNMKLVKLRLMTVPLYAVEGLPALLERL